MNNILIKTNNLCKEYQSDFGVLFGKTKPKLAVRDLNIEISEGEIIGYVGPNGAGKSTTIKMLIGILKPSSGTVLINGLDPFTNRLKIAKEIGVVFGQRTQLWWDLPLIDTLKLHKDIYNIDCIVFQDQHDWLVDVLNLEEIMHIPVRKLSFGQRMRCELAVTFIHNPKIVFLDEPTIGMDVIVKSRIREYLLAINKKKKVTIILTSHDLQDIESTCSRIIVVNEGTVFFDDTIENLRCNYAHDSKISLKYNGSLTMELMKSFKNLKIISDDYITFSINPHGNEFNKIVEIYNMVDVISLSIKEPTIEEIIKKIYIK